MGEVFSRFNGQMRYLRPASKEAVQQVIRENHYSLQFPRLTKHWLGYYDDRGEIIGGITLGWETRPRHTIQKLWPDMDTKDYFEIGKMAVGDCAGKNSASHLLSLTLNYIREYLPEIRVLFTWADGMLGKPGYVYQAANFLYAGYYETDSYFSAEGERVHPRTATKAIKDERTTKHKRPTMAQLSELGWSHYKGRQFKYLSFIHRKDRKVLLRSCKVELNRDYPKSVDLKWRRKLSKGVRVESGPSPFRKSAVTIYETKKEAI